MEVLGLLLLAGIIFLWFEFSPTMNTWRTRRSIERQENKDRYNRKTGKKIE